MVGLERTVVPLIGEQEFGLTSKTAIVSFIVSFGITKALCNLFAARLSETWGRKKVLVLGWIIGLPVPLIIIWANHWWWFDIANVLLGVNQALCWSMTVIMKVDLVGPRQRGLALGLNEFAGYVAVGGKPRWRGPDRKSTRLNSSHDQISYAVFCLKKKKRNI